MRAVCHHCEDAYHNPEDLAIILTSGKCVHCLAEAMPNIRRFFDYMKIQHNYRPKGWYVMLRGRRVFAHNT